MAIESSWCLAHLVMGSICYTVFDNYVVFLQDTLTHSLLICEVSPALLESLEEDKKVMEQIPAIRFDGALFEQVSSQLMTFLIIKLSIACIDFIFQFHCAIRTYLFIFFCSKVTTRFNCLIRNWNWNQVGTVQTQTESDAAPTWAKIKRCQCSLAWDRKGRYAWWGMLSFHQPLNDFGSVYLKNSKLSILWSWRITPAISRLDTCSYIIDSGELNYSTCKRLSRGEQFFMKSREVLWLSVSPFRILQIC